MTELSRLHDLAAGMTAEAWCEAFAQYAAGGDNPMGMPAFPDADIQRITNSKANAETMRDAASFYRILDDALSAHSAADGRLLDFGAGWGRVTRLLLRSLPPESISAVDVDARLVEAGAVLLPGIDFRKVESGEPLPFEDGSFATLIANSVFSHLSEQAHHFYLAEIARILQPGGLFVGTSLSPRVYEGWLEDAAYRDWLVGLLGPADTVRARLSAGDFVYTSTGRWLDYGIALLPEDYVQQQWRRYFDGVTTRRDHKQDVNIALKPS